MSAICGLVQQDKKTYAARRCSSVHAALQPYGRHAQGMWDGLHVALGSRLTRLLPEDQYDQQPLQGGSGRFVLVADVRLDNRAELGHKLNISASQLNNMADADVLLAAYEKWQQQLLDHLLGDFAFAIWDSERQSLFLARDHMGRRPLFYHQGHGWFAFASMPAGLLALPEIPMAPDEERVRDLLLLLRDNSERSYFAGIKRLLPGHYALLHSDGTLHSRRYWEAPTEERIYFKSDDDYVDAFLEKLEEAVRCRLRSTGSIASQLSAGFDSATISSIAAHQLADAGQNLHAFTSVPNPAGLPPSPYQVLNEGPLAAQVAALFPNINHHLVRTDDASIMDMLERTFELYNRPAKNVVNLLWDMQITRLAAAQGATTLLVGDLGNFTISYHGEHVLNSLLRECRIVELLQQLTYKLRGISNRRRMYVIYQMLISLLPDTLQSLLEPTVQRVRGNVSLGQGINPDLLADPQLLEYCRQLGRHPNMTARQEESRQWRQKALTRRDTAEHDKGRLALAGIDGRDPTADIRLIHYCQSIPVEQFNKNGSDRWLLRRALSRYWPLEVLNSRTKGKQGADWQYKINKEREGLFRELELLQEQPLARRLIDLPLIQEQLSAASLPGASNKTQVYFKLLRFIAIGHFIRMASDCGP
jgi:asparagine synthase (glutamine-hydrolysing)